MVLRWDYSPGCSESLREWPGTTEPCRERSQRAGAQSLGMDVRHFGEAQDRHHPVGRILDFLSRVG